MVKTVWGFLGKLFGTDKAVTSIIDNTSNALDKLWYTDEEKAEDKAKSASAARAMVIDWMRSTQGQNLSRRLIALAITSVWLLQYLSSMALSIVSVWMDDERLLKSAAVIGDYADGMTGAMMLILAFYFAAPEMGKIAEGALKRFGNVKR